jgi:hypothetical protein
MCVLSGDRVGDDLDEGLESERLPQDGRSPESGRFAHCLLVAGAHDDRGVRIARVNAAQDQPRQSRVVMMEADEVGDDQIGGQIRDRTLETLDKYDIVALLAKDIANEVPGGEVVIDDQDLSNSGTLPDSRRERNFDVARN